jgi:hypothetical protein
MNDLICISSIVIVGTSCLDCSQVAWSNIKLVNYLRPIIDQNHLVNKCKTRSHVKHGLPWLDCDSQIRTKLPNLWGIFDRILKNDLFDAWSFWFKKESFWFQKSCPWWGVKQGTSCLFSGRQVRSSVFLISETFSRMLMVPSGEGWPVFSNPNWGFLLPAWEWLEEWS